MKKQVIIKNLLVIGLLIFSQCNVSGQSAKDKNSNAAKIDSSKLAERREQLYLAVRGVDINGADKEKKDSVVATWIAILQSDPDFQNVNTAIEKRGTLLINRDKSVANGNDKNTPSLKEQPIEYYKSKGVSDPKAMMQTTL